MRKEGHAGLAFLLFSPIMLFFKSTGADMTYILVTCILLVALSSLPDLDTQWEIKHRGITHTLLFGMVAGVLFSVLIGIAYEALGWLMGFVAGFGGTISHLLGDALTHSPFKPFYPFSDRDVAFSFFKSSNKSVNDALLVLGIVAFFITYEPSFFWSIVNIF